MPRLTHLPTKLELSRWYGRRGNCLLLRTMACSTGLEAFCLSSSPCTRHSSSLACKVLPETGRAGHIRRKRRRSACVWAHSHEMAYVRFVSHEVSSC